MKEKRRFRIIPLQDTKLEQKVQLKLTSLNIKFQKHLPIYGQPDIFIEPNICVFIDGCYWHACNICEKGKRLKNYSTRRKIDSKITEKLASNGYSVVRFWEHEIENNLDGCINKIAPLLLKHNYQIE